MEEIMIALTNSIYLILEAISKFDITQIDTNKLAIAAQFFADTGRIAYGVIGTLINIVRAIKGY